MLARLPSLVLLGLTFLACSNAEDDAGTEANNPAPVCGGDSATLTPSGNTYDDSKPSSGSTPISFTMYVYPFAKRRPRAGCCARGRGHSIMSVGRASRDDELEDLALPRGTYYACRDQPGSCKCLVVRLTGGDAEFIWGAGPGGGHLETSGCVGKP